MKYKMVCGLLGIAICLSAVGCGTTDRQESADAVVTEAAVTPEAEGTSSGVTSDVDTENQENAGQNLFVYEEELDPPVSMTVTAIVESVEGNVLTISAGGTAAMHGGMDGEMPDMPEGMTGDMPQMPEGTDGEVPEMPEGTEGEVPEMPEGTDGEVPQMPSGTDGEVPDMPEGTEGEMPEIPEGMTGEQPDMQRGDREISGGVTVTLTIGDESVLRGTDSQAASLEDISVGNMLLITFDENSIITEITISDVTAGMGDMGGKGQGQPMGGGMASGVESYDAVTNYTEDTVVEGETFTSEGTDENAILVSDGANVTLSDITVNRTSTDSTGGDNSSFYGVGAAILATDGEVTIENADITTDAAGGAGVFAYGDGVVTVSDSTITTTQNTSGGIHVAGGGTLYAENLTVETDGESAAAIRSDRGGGTMMVDGGTYISNGLGSPALYCTADIAVNGAVLTATGSEAICMEGLNTIHLFDCDITGDMLDLEQNDTTWTIIVYQSLSGDSEVGNSTMQIIGGSLTSENGGLIYTTNTESDILMSDVDITYAADSEFFLMCTGNANERGWGQTGNNGSQCKFTALDQVMQGNVIWDSISTLDFYMSDGSTLTGAIVQDESYAGNGGEGYCNLYISSDSTWIVTGDSAVTNLASEGSIADEAGNTVSIVGTDGTVYVQGDSAYTITVDNYSDTADLSGVSQAASWEEYKK